MKKKGKKMKKIVLTFAAMMTMTMAFAGNDNDVAGNGEKAPEVSAVSMINNYDMSVNYKSLAGVLSLSDYQAQAVEIVHSQFVRDMKAAATAQEAQRGDMVKKAADKELQYMSYVLDKSQLKKFSQLLNLTLANRGLLVK
jgi:hypothetical protein